MNKNNIILKLLVSSMMFTFTIEMLCARDWNVDIKSDSGSNSLREIIDLAGHGDTIYLKTDTIFLTTNEIRLTKDITVIGDKTVIKRQKGEFRIFSIEKSINVFFQDIIIMGGIGPNNRDREHEPFEGGGGIFVDNELAKLTMVNCSFIGNKTKDDPYNVNRTSSGGYGGAIFIENGTTIIDSCNFSENTTGNGNKGLSFGGNGGMGGGRYIRRMDN